MASALGGAGSSIDLSAFPSSASASVSASVSSIGVDISISIGTSIGISARIGISIGISASISIGISIGISTRISARIGISARTSGKSLSGPARELQAQWLEAMSDSPEQAVDICSDPELRDFLARLEINLVNPDKYEWTVTDTITKRCLARFWVITRANQSISSGTLRTQCYLHGCSHGWGMKSCPEIPQLLLWIARGLRLGGLERRDPTKQGEHKSTLPH